ncbi:hypothetical protein [Lactobacillus kefiranofaciens]|uniref:hypothetical protein n=1 Tax=Lactobacillus kefiranofaciens TaxID=267818 RepID=UPI001FB8C71F|nr:hypothetical protein [Lactobacillus kefiranofaciens]MCJ2171910.1 hypothetical protein [Lactobacillus kefiranofaciens]
MKIITLTDLRKDLFKIIMAKKEYHHLKELEYLEKTGTLNTIWYFKYYNETD